MGYHGTHHIAPVRRRAGPGGPGARGAGTADETHKPEAAAGHIDWHQMAALVQRGCPPWLALRILC
jgi:hypothetical protein